MSEHLGTELTAIVEGLEKGSDPLESTGLANIGEQIAKAFGVQPDEVAILAVTGRDKFLKFIIPQKLQLIGTIPLSSTSALAARTARDKRPEVINNFTAARHATVFEGVPLGRRHGEQIHKIMSAPIVVDNKIAGVIQVCRKGHSPADSGPDFSQQDLRELISVTHVLGRFLGLCKVS